MSDFNEPLFDPQLEAAATILSEWIDDLETNREYVSEYPDSAMTTVYVVLQRPDPTIEVEDAERWLNALDDLMDDLPADLAAHREALTALRQDSLRMLGRRVDRLRRAL